MRRTFFSSELIHRFPRVNTPDERFLSTLLLETILFGNYFCHKGFVVANHRKGYFICGRRDKEFFFIVKSDLESPETRNFWNKFKNRSIFPSVGNKTFLEEKIFYIFVF